MPSARSAAAGALAALAALLLAAVAVHAASQEVDMQSGLKFSPATKEVNEGDTVHWVNQDAVPHTATRDTGSEQFDTGNVDAGKTSKSIPFNHVGSYGYYCTIHGQTMSGTIDVNNVAPTVHILAPTSDGIIEGKLTVEVSASDAAGGISSAEASIDGGRTWQALSQSGTTWSYTFPLANKPHGTVLDVLARATDDDGADNSRAQAPEEYHITIDAPPTANFDATPPSPTTSDLVQFNDTSTDPDEGDHPAAWAWDFGDGATSSVRNATHQFLRKGLANVTLTVKDGLGAASAPFTQQLTILNSPPRPAFNVSNDAPGLRGQVQFTDASVDIDGRVLSWSWDFGDGANATTRNATHAYAAVGDYTARLTVKDDDDAVANVTRVLHVQDIVGKPPSANLTADPRTGQAPFVVNFTAKASDPDGTVRFATLDYGDGSKPDNISGALLPDGLRLNHTYGEGGDFDAVLRAVDNDGNVATAHLGIHADPPANRPPRASFTVLPDLRPAKNTVVRFNDTSTDPDAGDRVASWRWDFGDGTLYCCDRALVDHVYTRVGRFNVVLTATDARGAVGASPAKVLDVQGQAPAVLLAAQPVSGRAPLTVNFTLAARDTDGHVVSWSLDYGDGQRDNDTGPPPNRTFLHTYIGAGVVAAQLQATDDDGLVGQAVAQIQVQQALPPTLVLPASAVNIGPTGERLTYRFGLLADVARAASYAWSFGDGHTGTGREVTYAYDQAGSYEVRLSVTDASGAVLATASARLDVVEERAGSGPRVRSEVANGVVRVAWDADPRAAGYQVWRAGGATPDAASFQVLAVVRGDASYSDLNVKDGAVYTYRVTFFSPNGDGRFESLAELNRLTQFRLLGSTTATALVDSDGDGVGDSQDAFPHDPTRTTGKLPGPELPAALLVLAAAAAWQRRRSA